MQLTIEQMTVRAASVIVGTVSALANEPQAGRAYTLVTIAVERTVKGPASAQVIVRVAGGTVGEYTQTVEDTPAFAAGERVLLFLDGADGLPGVVGGIQGKFTVDRATGWAARR